MVKSYFSEILAKMVEKGGFYCVFPEYDVKSIVSENLENFPCGEVGEIIPDHSSQIGGHIGFTNLRSQIRVFFDISLRTNAFIRCIF